MAFTTGTGTFANGSTTVTNVSLSSGTLAYFASGTRMIIGANPVTAEVEAVAAPTVTTITLRSPWPHTGGTYNFLANQTSEGLRDAVQSIRNNNTTLQSYIDSISKAPNADTVLVRTSTGAARVADGLNADEAVALGQLPDDVADLYAKNNILGTVSETAGAPTGAIIERGSNANGEYVKYADGTLICTRKSSIHFQCISNGVTYSPAWNFPYQFLNIETLVVYGAAQPADNTDTYGLIYPRDDNITTSNVIFAVRNGATAQEHRLTFHLAIGRWY